MLEPPSDVTELFQRYDTTLATLLDKVHGGGRSSTGHDAAHHGMMLSVMPRSQQRGAREGLQTTTFQSVRASMAGTVQPPACSLSTEVR